MKPGQQPIESTTDASGIIDVDAQKPVDEVDAKPKTSKELEDEIKKMEEDIKRLKAENEQLRNE